LLRLLSVLLLRLLLLWLLPRLLRLLRLLLLCWALVMPASAARDSATEACSAARAVLCGARLGTWSTLTGGGA
jgi:hypothetical protein